MPTIAKQIGQMVKEEVRKEFGKQRSPSPANIGRNRRNSARREMWITNPVENPPVFVARKSSVPYVPPTPRREDADDHIPSEFKAKTTTSNLVISGVAAEPARGRGRGRGRGGGFGGGFGFDWYERFRFVVSKNRHGEDNIKNTW